MNFENIVIDTVIESHLNGNVGNKNGKHTKSIRTCHSYIIAWSRPFLDYKIHHLKTFLLGRPVLSFFFLTQGSLEMNGFPHLVLCVSLPLRMNWPRYRDATVAVYSCAPHTWRANGQILLALASNSGKTLVLACASCQRNKTTRASKIIEEEGSKSRKKKYE